MRMTIHLDEQEQEALLAMSKRDVRLPRDQVRYVLQQALKQHGLLPQEGTKQGASCASDEVNENMGNFDA